MKKLIIITLIMFASADLAFSGEGATNIYDSAFELQEEAYIDDIPFSTLNLALQSSSFKEDLAMSEEGYVKDIPFDTEQIAAAKMLYEMICCYRNESYVDDIPFCTDYHYNKYCVKNLVKEYKNEPGVLDIPFDTYAVAYNAMFINSVRKYSNEPEVADIPGAMICSDYCPKTSLIAEIRISQESLKDLRKADRERLKENIENAMQELDRILKSMEENSYYFDLMKIAD